VVLPPSLSSSRSPMLLRARSKREVLLSVQPTSGDRAVTDDARYLHQEAPHASSGSEPPLPSALVEAAPAAQSWDANGPDAEPLCAAELLAAGALDAQQRAAAPPRRARSPSLTGRLQLSIERGTSAAADVAMGGSSSADAEDVRAKGCIAGRSSRAAGGYRGFVGAFVELNDGCRCRLQQ